MRCNERGGALVRRHEVINGRGSGTLQRRFGLVGRCSPGTPVIHPVQPSAPGCITTSAGATKLRTTQRNQIHHRCTGSRRSMKSLVIAAIRRRGTLPEPEGRTLRRRQNVFTQTAE